MCDRSLADACGACGDSDCIIDLLVYMDDQGLLPDHQMLHAVVRALAANPPPPTPPVSAQPSESSSTQSVAKTPETATTSTSTTSRLYSLFRGSAAAPQPATPAPAPSIVVGDSAVPTANTTEKRDRSESVTALTLPTKLRNKLINPIEVWTFNDWRSLQRGQSSLVSRRTPVVVTENVANESRVTKLLFGPSTVAQDGSVNRTPTTTVTSSAGASTQSGTSGATHSSGEKETSSSASSLIYSLPSAAVHAVAAVPSVALHTVTYVPSVALHTVASVLSPTVSHPHSQPSTTASSSGVAGSNQALQITANSAVSMSYSDSSFRWSSSVLSDGNVPRLQWSDLTSPTRLPIFCASKKLSRHMRICEKKLIECFPELSIELESPFGTLCPNKKCPIRRPLTIGEIHQGWNESAGL